LSLLDFLHRRKAENLLWETEDSGLKVEVWEKHDRREMRFGNHIMQSVFSRNNPYHLVLPYSRFMVLGLIFCPDPKSALHLGLGGGSIPRWLHFHFPELQQKVIEKNASVIEAANRFFDFPVDKRLCVIHEDAEKIIPKLESKFDLIFLDAFGEYGAPEEVTNVNFLKKINYCLNPSGWLVGNLWTVTGDFIKFRRQWRTTFKQLYQARANAKGNIILYASQNSKVSEMKSLKYISKKLQKHHQLDFYKMLRKLEFE
tara:strand:- start:866 stop:1636 length:771 start_codon:yes stop_codon:yes gene_type:complete